MGCALGHRSSPFRRFGAIFGVPNAYRDLYIDLRCQTFHKMPLRRSPVSSRDLASSGLLCMPTKEVRRSGYADTHGSGSARSGGMYSESAPARTVEPLEALGIDPWSVPAVDSMGPLTSPNPRIPVDG